MKRTNLVLDADLLERATRALGAKTYSAAVNQALEQVLRIEKIRGLSEFYGQGLWEGDLSEMRGDRPTKRPGHGKRKKPK
jgi:Arc/MetJ family transcription regulator